MELIVQEEYGCGILCAPLLGTLSTSAEHAMKCAWSRLPDLQLKTASIPLHLPCSSAPTSSMNGWQKLPDRAGSKWGVKFLYRDFGRGFEPVSGRPESWGYTCRNTAAAYSARRNRYAKQIARDLDIPLKHFPQAQA